MADEKVIPITAARIIKSTPLNVPASFADQVYQKAIEATRAADARTNAEWNRIRLYVLHASDRLDAQLPSVNPWPIYAELEGFVKSAVDYYMQHAKRFGIDKNGRPKSKHLAQKGR